MGRFTILLIGFAVSLLVFSIDIPGHQARAEDENADVIAPADKAACLECHSEDIHADRFTSSAHGKLTCQDCHQGINQYPHPEKATFKPQCVTCHAQEVGALVGSRHAHSDANKPLACATCHGEKVHELTRLSSQTPAQQDALCARCHAANAHALAKSVHGGKATGKPHPSCVSCHPGAPHGVTAPPSVKSAKEDAACRMCHTSMAKTLPGSAHGTPMNCLSCHGNNAHAISAPITSSATTRDAQCRRCHTDVAKALPTSAHGASARLHGKPITCFTCHDANPHAVARVVKHGTALNDTRCRSCHTDVADKLARSAHDKPGNSQGTVVSCLTCHGGNPHGVAPSKHLTALQKSAKCEACHTDSVKRLVSSAHGPAKVHATTGRPINCLTCHGDSQHAVTPPAKLTSLQKSSSCRECHPDEARLVAGSVHGKHAVQGKAQPDCATCHQANPKDITQISTMNREQLEASCRQCHNDLAKSLSHDVHARPDKVPGDHPTCVSCHGGVAHGISTPKRLSPLEKVELCARCHRDEQLMARYGITADTVPAYEATIHGRSVMHLQQDGATCTDCHGLHGVLAVNDPQAPVNPRQTAKICMKCHPGNSKDFAFPYASHFRLSVERSLIYPIEHVLHWLLRIGGVLAVFGVVVLLGLRRRLVTHPRWVEAARAAILMGMITAVTLLLVAWIMRAVAEPKWQIPFVSGWIILAGAALISVIVRFITWSSNRP